MDTLILMATILIGLIVPIYLYLRMICLTYWKRHGVASIPPSFYYGNVKKFVKGELCFGVQLQELYKEFRKRGSKHGGIYVFFTPMYLALDPGVLRHILVRDFNNFVNHDLYANEEDDPLSGYLFNLKGNRWRYVRTKLSTSFSKGKIKMMFPMLRACSEGLDRTLCHYSIIKEAVDIKDIVSRFTTDIIGSCGFGIECNSLRDPDSEFRKYGREIFNVTFSIRIKRLLPLLLPKSILKLLRFKLTRSDVEEFFMNVVRQTVEYRDKNEIERKDFVHLLLQLRDGKKVADDGTVIETEESTTFEQPGLTMNEIAAQCFSFFSGGFETAATALTFVLLELALNQDIQQNLRKEIQAVLRDTDDQLTYEAITDMTYLEKVVYESLRKNPPVTATNRVCENRYIIPESNIVLEPNTRVQIPILAIHHDPEYYPNPEIFDPERFTDENRAKRPPHTFIPFGDGPRICVGTKFGLMQIKIGLVQIIRKYNVTVNKKTKLPIQLESSSFLLSAKGGVWLNVSKVDEE